MIIWTYIGEKSSEQMAEKGLRCKIKEEKFLLT